MLELDSRQESEEGASDEPASTVKMLQSTKIAPVPVGLKSFVGVARAGEKVTKIIKGTERTRRERRERFSLVASVFAAVLYSTSQQRALSRRSAALEISQVADFLMVAEQQPKVALQHQFWSDVSGQLPVPKTPLLALSGCRFPWSVFRACLKVKRKG